MINVSENHWIPDENYKYISNGEVWTDSIYLGKNDNIANWYDTNDEPPIPEEDISDDEALQIIMGGAE